MAKSTLLSADRVGGDIEALLGIKI
jgi:hypothetical protein